MRPKCAFFALSVFHVKHFLPHFCNTLFTFVAFTATYQRRPKAHHHHQPSGGRPGPTWKQARLNEAEAA